MIATTKAPLSPEMYLELETKSDIRHEYINGELLAMAATTDIHNLITGNCVVSLKTQLRESDCIAYFADIKARIEAKNCFYYPDLLVTCNPRNPKTFTYKRFPKLTTEVLSESADAFDRGDKFNDYQTLVTLEDYLLINTQSQ